MKKIYLANIEITNAIKFRCRKPQSFRVVNWGNTPEEALEKLKTKFRKSTEGFKSFSASANAVIIESQALGNIVMHAPYWRKEDGTLDCDSPCFDVPF